MIEEDPVPGGWAVGGCAPATSPSLKLLSKAGQDTGKELLNMAFISSGECGAWNPNSEKSTGITSVK